MHSNEDFEVGGCGCWLIALCVAAVVALCVWRAHHPIQYPTKKAAIEVVMYGFQC